MKMLKNILPKALIIFVIFTVVCGVLYTGVVTGIAQVFFPDQANGSIIEVDGKKYAVYSWGNSILIISICGDVL